MTMKAKRLLWKGNGMEKKYICVADLQGDNYMVGQVMTIKQWRDWFIADREKSGCEEQIEIAHSTTNQETITRIATWYGLTFMEVLD